MADKLRENLLQYGSILTVALEFFTIIAPLLKVIEWPEGYEVSGKWLSIGIGVVCLLTIFILFSSRDPDSKPIIGAFISFVVFLGFVWWYLHAKSDPKYTDNIVLVYIGAFGIGALSCCLSFLGVAIFQRSETRVLKEDTMKKITTAQPTSKEQDEKVEGSGLDRLSRLVFQTDWKLILAEKEVRKGKSYWKLYKLLSASVLADNPNIRKIAIRKAIFLSRYLSYINRLVPVSTSKKSTYNFLNFYSTMIINVEKQKIKADKDKSKPYTPDAIMAKNALDMIFSAAISAFHYGIDQAYVNLKQYLKEFKNLSLALGPHEMLTLNPRVTQRRDLLEEYLTGRFNNVELHESFKRSYLEAMGDFVEGNWKQAAENFLVLGENMIEKSKIYTDDRTNKKFQAIQFAMSSLLTAAACSEQIDGEKLAKNLDAFAVITRSIGSLFGVLVPSQYQLQAILRLIPIYRIDRNKYKQEIEKVDKIIIKGMLKADDDFLDFTIKMINS